MPMTRRNANCLVAAGALMFCASVHLSYRPARPHTVGQHTRDSSPVFEQDPRDGPRLPIQSLAAEQAQGLATQFPTTESTAPPTAESAAPPTNEMPTATVAPEKAAQASAASTGLDGSLESALRLAAPAGSPRFVFITFGNKGVLDHLLNFLQHVRSVRAQHVVGAVDVDVYELLSERGTPVYKTPLALTAYTLDGSNQHSSGSWKKFAGMRTGEVAKIVAAGYSVM